MTLPRVLLVEDNPIDVKMIKRALKLGGLIEEPVVVNDGAPAISLLKRENDFAGALRPDLVVLDLNLITVDGTEVLSFIRQTPELDQVSVAILSSTPRDFGLAWNFEAECYFVKPSDVAAFERLGSQLLECYARSPRNPNS